MDSGVAPMEPSVPIVRVAQQMRAYRDGVVPVGNNGKYRGVITLMDIVDTIANDQHIAEKPAGSVVNRHYPVILPSEDIVNAAKVMASSSVKTLPVVQDGRLVGMFSLEDMARGSLALAAMVFSKQMAASLNNDNHRCERKADDNQHNGEKH